MGWARQLLVFCYSSLEPGSSFLDGHCLTVFFYISAAHRASHSPTVPHPSQSGHEHRAGGQEQRQGTGTRVVSQREAGTQLRSWNYGVRLACKASEPTKGSLIFA